MLTNIQSDFQRIVLPADCFIKVPQDCLILDYFVCTKPLLVRNKDDEDRQGVNFIKVTLCKVTKALCTLSLSHSPFSLITFQPQNVKFWEPDQVHSHELLLSQQVILSP